VKSRRLTQADVDGLWLTNPWPLLQSGLAANRRDRTDEYAAGDEGDGGIRERGSSVKKGCSDIGNVTKLARRR